jgi:hypothetical protein
MKRFLDRVHHGESQYDVGPELHDFSAPQKAQVDARRVDERSVSRPQILDVKTTVGHSGHTRVTPAHARVLHDEIGLGASSNNCAPGFDRYEMACVHSGKQCQRPA